MENEDDLEEEIEEIDSEEELEDSDNESILLNNYGEVIIDDTDFKPNLKKRFFKSITTRPQLAREIARRTGFSMKAIKVIINVIIDIFHEAIDKQLEISIPGLLRLYHQTLPARRGVNAYLSKIAGETVYQDFPESRRTIIRLAAIQRKNSKQRFYENKKKKENMDKTMEV